MASDELTCYLFADDTNILYANKNLNPSKLSSTVN